MNSSNQALGKLATKYPKAASPSERRRQIAMFFHQRRLACGLSLEQVAESLGAVDAGQLRAFESAIDPIPLDFIFGLTNVLNIPPEDVMNLIYDVYNENDL